MSYDIHICKYKSICDAEHELISWDEIPEDLMLQYNKYMGDIKAPFDPYGEIPTPFAMNYYFNITFNVRPIFQKLFSPDKDTPWYTVLGGKPRDETIELISKALLNMEINMSEYEKLNPENGYGSAEGVKNLLIEIKKTLEEFREYGIENAYLCVCR